MYNFESQSIPLFFPVLAGVQLQPWFAAPILDEGLQLIREKRITGFHCIRNGVGALINLKAPVTLQFAKSTTLRQGFFIQNSHCGLCRQKSDEKGCVHLAALAILSLTVPAAPAPAMPIPLAFAGSSWLKIGNFLHDWLHRTPYTVQHAAGEGFSRWRIVPAEGSVEVTVPDSWGEVGELLFSRESPKPATKKSERGMALLNSQLRIRAMTENERTLEQAGNSSIGWQRDTSFWIWLTRFLSIFHDDTLPDFQSDRESSRFILRIGDTGQAGALTIVLPRAKTWELVKTGLFRSEAARILPVAKECYRVFFHGDSSLEVRPCLHLADGRVLDRGDLADQRYSAAYYLEGEGFLPTLRLSAEGTFRQPATSAAAPPPLLAFLRDEKIRDQSFTVAANDIPAFVDANRQPLYHPDNIVEPELLHLRVRDFPDKLVIDAFEEQDGWCYLSCHYGLGNTSITLSDILTARKNKLSCLPGREWLQIKGTPLAWFYDLAEDRYAADGSGRIRLSYRETIALTAVMPEVEITIRQEPLRKRLAGLVDAAGWTDDRALSEVPGHLRSYQRNGLAWLHRLASLGIGGLLADDMGLGKTHQGLALLRMAVRDGREGLLLVVCPTSVVLNWAEKIDSFYPGLDYAVYYGPQRDLQKAQEQGLILTTYGVVRQDLDQLRLLAFDIILLDEIQQLKNRTTAIHQAVAALNGRVKIGLTGTPVENSLQDLRSLFDICLPGLLGSEREFARNYVEPIVEAGNTVVRDRLTRLIHPFILRRSRRQVLTELPEIIEDDRICELLDEQISLYREVLKEREQDLEGLVSGTAAIPYLNILATITRLKQICCHPCLVQGSDHPGDYGSGKWELFVELTGELLAADMKFVVFSQFTGMIALIKRYLSEAGIGFASLTGEMPIGKRRKMITEFATNPDCRVFCASLLAGGLGIDLTGAQAVIHYDRWWNPAREEQATARVHRMGQKNVVQVFRLITRGTLEEKIHHLITQKRDLAASLIQEDEAGIIKQLDRRQLAELFRFTPSLSG